MFNICESVSVNQGVDGHGLHASRNIFEIHWLFIVFNLIQYYS